MLKASFASFNLARLNGFAARFAFAAALAMIAGVAAFWFWQWVTPARSAAIPVFTGDVAMTVRATPIFEKQTLSENTPSENIATSFFDWRLLGIVANEEGQGHAVFRVKNLVNVLVAGKTTEGVTLSKLTANEATLRDENGTTRVFVLREKSGESSIIASTPQALSEESNALKTKPSSKTRGLRGTATTTAATTSACAPEGYKGIVVKLNPELLQGALLSPETFYAPLEKTANGIAVKTGNGHTAMLGLRTGDVIKSANDIALTHIEDIVSAIISPLANGQTVKLSGTRAAQTLDLLIVNVSACP